MSELRTNKIYPRDGLPAGATAGGIIQMVEVTDTDQTTFGSTPSGWTATGFSASITPTSASNKVLVMVSTSYYIDQEDTTGGLTVFRNGTTNLGGGSYGLKGIYFFGFNETEDFQVPVNMQVIDSPATTSSVSYEVYLKGDKSTVRLNGIRNHQQSIILMEVSA